MRSPKRIFFALVVALIACRDKPTTDDEPKPKPNPSSDFGDSRPLVSQAQLEARLATLPQSQWFGLRLGARKIGFAHSTLRRDGDEIVANAAFEIQRSDGSETIVMREERRYDATAPYALASVKTKDVASGETVEITVGRRGGAFDRRRSVNGTLSNAGGIPASRETLVDEISSGFLDADWLEMGMQGTLVALDVEKGIDEISRVRVVEKRRQRVAGVMTEVALIEVRSDNQPPVRATVASGGLQLEGHAGAFAFQLQDERSAKSDVLGIDLASSFIQVKRPLGEPSRIKSLSIELRLDPALIGDGLVVPALPNQKVTRTDRGFRLELSAGIGAPVTAAERRESLASTLSIDAEAMAIAALAKEIADGTDTGDPNSRRTAVSALNKWVYRNLEKDLATDLSTASSVLEQRVGDCTEHTLLFVALARALKIPAREVSGLTYAGDEDLAFGWHAWAEVEIDGHWQRVDPSWGEDLANASHITLGFGDDSRWISLIGGLEVEILAVNGS